MYTYYLNDMCLNRLAAERLRSLLRPSVAPRLSVALNVLLQLLSVPFGRWEGLRPDNRDHGHTHARRVETTS